MDNYFNYFTEIEERFQRSRGAPMLLSTLDWALIESWKEAGIPLEAVCLGIERTFQKYARRPRRFAKVNSLGYCTQEVMAAADEAKQASVESGDPGASKHQVPPPFPADDVRRFLDSCIRAFERAAARELENAGPVVGHDLTEAAAAIRRMAAQGAAAILADVESAERCLAALEEKVTASLTRGSPLEVLSQIHEEVDRSIVPYRRTMNATQIELLHRQFVKKRLFEHYQIPRVSLFYL
jgi:hypothetical protein